LKALPSPIGGQWYLTLRFFFAALRLCVKSVVLRSNLTKRREGAKTRKVKPRQHAATSQMDSAMVLKNN